MARIDGRYDNAIGCAIMMEAARILQTLELSRDARFAWPCGVVKSKVCWDRRLT